MLYLSIIISLHIVKLFHVSQSYTNHFYAFILYQVTITIFATENKNNNDNMCKKFKFDHTNKWYMHNPVPVLENDTHKLLWGFDIHMDHQISARKPDLIIINKKERICKNVDFAVERIWKEG